jgi:hypothetical protein
MPCGCFMVLQNGGSHKRYYSALLVWLGASGVVWGLVERVVGLWDERIGRGAVVSHCLNTGLVSKFVPLRVCPFSRGVSSTCGLSPTTGPPRPESMRMLHCAPASTLRRACVVFAHVYQTKRLKKAM